MYIKNKAGIYVYSRYVYSIDNKSYYENSICTTELVKFRMINYKLYGIYITHNVHKK